jgi:chromosome segregation ATPase
MADTTDSMGQELEKAATELKRKIVGGEDDAAADTSQQPVADSPQDGAPVEQLEELETELDGSGSEPAPEEEPTDTQIDVDEVAERDRAPKTTNVSEPAAGGPTSQGSMPDDSPSSEDMDAGDDLEQKMQSLRESVEADQLPADTEGEPLSEKVDEALEKAEENRRRMQEMSRNDLENELDDLRGENRRLESRLQETRQELDEATPEDLEGEVEELKEKNEKLEKEVKEAREKLDDVASAGVEGEVDELEKQNQRLELELDKVRKTLSQVEGENDALASGLEKLTESPQDVAVRLNEADTDFEEVESHLESVDDRLEEVSDEVSEHDREIDSLHEKRKELAEKLESLALRVESNEHGQGKLAEKLESLSEELDRYERRLHEENAPSHMVEEKDRMRDILDSASTAVDRETSRTTEPKQQKVEEELSAFSGQNRTVTEQDFRELFELVEENSERIEQLSQEVGESSADGQGLSAVNQEVAGLRGRTQQNEREIQRILDTVEELSEILKMELRSGGL